MIAVWSVIAALFLIVIFCCGYVLYNNRKRITMLEHSLNHNIQALQRELDVVNSGAVGVGTRLIRVEKKLNGSIEKQQQFETNNADYYSYNKAALLAEEGVNAAHIAEQCGLSEAEANLMALINHKSTFDAANSPN